jgi:hypothetical protein
MLPLSLALANHCGGGDVVNWLLWLRLMVVVVVDQTKSSDILRPIDLVLPQLKPMFFEKMELMWEGNLQKY